MYLRVSAVQSLVDAVHRVATGHAREHTMHLRGSGDKPVSWYAMLNSAPMPRISQEQKQMPRVIEANAKGNRSRCQSQAARGRATVQSVQFG